MEERRKYGEEKVNNENGSCSNYYKFPGNREDCMEIIDE